ncbi:OLC1v1038400C1 [Oldenlandia corymbosa var. corymbosa]|uniref:OLC1v1038400C1 n=1 Tax=Oldenlandia corymbosa var. corymbosa TaxID=529605 RepID=A0AAV1CZN0_OLDCO|nr:OLC1v1038400C1 [Oldenlandia corymbosa var. corymbosa]
MEWSAKSATNAYLDTLELCKKQKENCNPCENHHKDLESIEFISALAAGMRAKLMVEVTPEVSTSTVALAAAARQTGGKLVCILPEDNKEQKEKKEKNECHQVIDDSGLGDMVEFRTGDPAQVLPSYGDIDFSLVDCKSNNNEEDYGRLLGQLDDHVKTPRRRSMNIVANNFVEGCSRRVLSEGGRIFSRGGVVVGDDDDDDQEGCVKQYSTGKGMSNYEYYNRKREKRKNGGIAKRKDHVNNIKSTWLVKIDEKTGEEHIFRMMPK